MKNSRIEKFFWKIAEKLVHFLVGEVEKLARLWHSGSPSWIIGTPLGRWHVGTFNCTLVRKNQKLARFWHVVTETRHARMVQMPRDLANSFTPQQEEIQNFRILVFLYLSRIIGGHFSIPRETMEWFFDLNIQKHQNGIDTMIFRIQRFECVNKVWTFIFFGFPNGRN